MVPKQCVALGLKLAASFEVIILSPKHVEAIQNSRNVSGEASFWEGSSAEQRTPKTSTVLAQNIGSKNGTRSEVNYLIYEANSRVGGARGGPEIRTVFVCFFKSFST